MKTSTVDYGILSDDEENEDFSEDSMDEFLVGDNEVDEESDADTDFPEEE